MARGSEPQRIGGTFAAVIRRRRRELRLTLRELARRSDLYETLLSGWELGRSLPRSPRQVEKLGLALSIEPSELLMCVASDRQVRSAYSGRLPNDVALAFRQVVTALRQIARGIEVLAAAKPEIGQHG